VIDCDVHCAPDSLETLLAHMDPYWHSYVEDATIALGDPGSYPPHLRGTVPSSAAELTALLDRDGTDLAILTCIALDGVHRHPDYATAVARGLNDWMREELLDHEPRLRASAVVSTTDIEAAAAEIDRVAADPRFVQVLLPVRSDVPYGNRLYHPLYAAAERHGLRIALHAWGRPGNAPTTTGIAATYLEDYVSNAHIAQNQLLSLVAEGVFHRFPRLGVAVVECGFTWLPPLLWRFDKDWKGVWREVPWIKRRPSELVREHVRLTTTPGHLPPSPRQVAEVVEMVGPQLLLHASDHPHEHGPALAPLLSSVGPEVASAISAGNAAAFYRMAG
jgi:predicted TIM-barrel fold metal-dependent hydrolase